VPRPGCYAERRTVRVLGGVDTLSAMTGTNGPEDVGPNVFWDPIPPFADEIEAKLEDGTRIRPVIGIDGRRLAFDRPLPWGTPIYRGERVAWRVSEKYRGP